MRKIFGLLFIFSFIFPLTAEAFAINTYDNMPVEGDLILGPGKVELFVDPGESVVRDMTLTNRTGKTLDISVEIEDFTGDPGNSTKLLGEEKGPYSLRDYIKPEKNSFRLAHGERAVLPITIDVPANAEPGGLYGAAIISAKTAANDQAPGESEVAGQVNITSRLAQLYFVRVSGDVKEEGKFLGFAADKRFYSRAPVNFSINYENTGKVHLNPYAKIDITNILGKKIDTIEVAPWFVMPGFSREKAVVWNKGLAFGRYTATLQLNLGYNNAVETAKVNFYIIPLKAVLYGGAIVILLAFVAWLFLSKFEIKKKQ